jgi:hypothetical protein
VTGELDPWRLNLPTKMRSGGNGMWGPGPAHRKQSLKKKKIFKVGTGTGTVKNSSGYTTLHYYRYLPIT